MGFPPPWDIGLSRTKVDARPFPCLASRCVSSQCSCLGTVCIPVFWVVGLSSVCRVGHRGCYPQAAPGQLQRAAGPPSGARNDDMIKAVSSSCTALSLSAPAPQSSRATARCPDRDDMIKAACHLHCLVLACANSKEQSGHCQVHALTTGSRLCHHPVLPCLCRCQLRRALGPPPGAGLRHDQGCVIILHCLV